MHTAGYDMSAPNTPDQFAKFIASDIARWAGVVQKANIGVKQARLPGCDVRDPARIFATASDCAIRRIAGANRGI
jgi:hypothetical protein